MVHNIITYSNGFMYSICFKAVEAGVFMIGILLKV